MKEEQQKKELDPRQVLEQASDAVIDKSMTIHVDVNPQSRLDAWLIKKGIKKKKRSFIIRPIYLGSLIRISRILLSIDLSTYNAKDLNSNYEMIDRNTGHVARVIAIAIQNNKHEPDVGLMRFILNNFSTADMMSVLTVVVKQMDLLSFMSTIVSIKGMNILEKSTAGVKSAGKSETSPTDQGS
jgi:hypothetical protein